MINWRRFFDFRDGEDSAKPFLEHLEDLRIMLMKMVAVLGLSMIGSFVFRVQLAAFVQSPLLSVAPERAANLQSLGVADSFTISMQLAFYAGLIISFPFLLYFLAEFILPALTPVEKKMLLPVCIIGMMLFLVGVSFCFFVVLPQTLAFFFQDAQQMKWQPTWTVREYYSFTTQFVLAFGLAFELPLVVLALVKLGLLDAALLRRTRAHAIVIIFAVAAVITPTSDILTLVLMGGPMYVLYEICIWIATFMERKEKKASKRPPMLE